MAPLIHLIIFGTTGVVILGLIILRLLRKTVPLDRRIQEWAARQGLTVISSERVADFSWDLASAEASPEVRLRLRDAQGWTGEARVRFDAAVVGHDSEHVRWTRKFAPG